MNRRFLGILGLVIVVGIAGCAGFGTVTSEEGLAAEPPQEYQWESEANASITIENGQYMAVYRIDGRDEIRFHQRTRYGDDRPVSMQAIRFRYPDGTIVNASEMSVEETRSGVHVVFPDDEGQFAYTGSHRTRNFRTEAYVSGTYEVILPPGYRAENLILGTIRPGGHETEIDDDDRLHIRWDDLGANSVVVRYYLERDVTLLTGLIVIASFIAILAMGYVYRQIQDLRRRREEAGLDIDINDEDRRRPPPGMR